MLEAAALLHYLKEKWLNKQLREIIYFSKKRNIFLLQKKIPNQTNIETTKAERNKEEDCSMLPEQDQPQMELIQYSLSFLALSAVIKNCYYIY